MVECGCGKRVGVEGDEEKGSIGQVGDRGCLGERKGWNRRRKDE